MFSRTITVRAYAAGSSNRVRPQRSPIRTSVSWVRSQASCGFARQRVGEAEQRPCLRADELLEAIRRAGSGHRSLLRRACHILTVGRGETLSPRRSTFRDMECSGPSSVVFDSSLTAYDFGPSHPMSPIRVDLTMRLARELGVLDRLTVVPAPFADDAQIATVHDAELIDAVTRAGKDPGSIGFDDHGLGTDDNPVFADMHLAAAHVVGASLEAFRQVQSGESLHSANIAGGLHHAMRDRSSGFCIYNDVAIGIQWLLDQGVERVAYVDVDVHHGDGVEAIFYDDPRVLTISLHETGQMLFPGTGFPADSGGPGAEGTAVNVALPPGTADAGWLRAFHAIVPPLVRAFEPRRAGHPARLRLPHGGPARPPDADRRRPAGVVPGPPRPRPRGLRGPLGGDRRGRVRPGRGGAPRLDPPPGHRLRPARSSRRTDTPARVARPRARGLGPAGAVPDDRRPRRRPGGTGRRGTTRPPRWTARSTRRAPRCSPGTGSFPTSEAPVRGTTCV